MRFVQEVTEELRLYLLQKVIMTAAWTRARRGDLPRRGSSAAITAATAATTTTQATTAGFPPRVHRPRRRPLHRPGYPAAHEVLLSRQGEAPPRPGEASRCPSPSRPTAPRPRPSPRRSVWMEQKASCETANENRGEWGVTFSHYCSSHEQNQGGNVAVTEPPTSHFQDR